MNKSICVNHGMMPQLTVLKGCSSQKRQNSSKTQRVNLSIQRESIIKKIKFITNIYIEANTTQIQNESQREFHRRTIHKNFNVSMRT